MALPDTSKDTTGTTVASRHKVSYCLRDSRRLKDAVAPTGETYSKCSRDARQGISPGWGDLCDFDLAGQTLRLPGSLEDGTYCLFMTADPFDFTLAVAGVPDRYFF